MSKRIRQQIGRYNFKRRLRGKVLLSKVTSFSCYQQSHQEKTCTTARKFIRNNSIQPPCVITVLKISGSEEKFFLSNNGLFSYKYAIENHKLFSPEIASVAS
ncbi:DUF3155 domain-containing protein [Komarekiella sp. 'clone 1']|uniref:DUF3155 domain-containing protein n=1 Tax=Komarekiella delphini-convector SJRDD-AB1 TaxID=2593771 RepID=A0AA40SUL0_9NOST|nr:DUF3155 domain-containing protein [Komarekiella delphini-convector]MBD6615339.1 DUF3155 domain-containing protein [Komarekiella delphini-convector SJRDD-AB1]